jgi:hypothetical protein
LIILISLGYFGIGRQLHGKLWVWGLVKLDEALGEDLIEMEDVW